MVARPREGGPPFPDTPIPGLPRPTSDEEAEQPPPEATEPILAPPDEERINSVRAAVAAGELGLGFSAGGFLYCFHLGVLWELERLGILSPRTEATPGTIMAGASAGSLAIATFHSGITRAGALEALKAFAADCRSAGTRGRLSGVLQTFLHNYLPDDAHERCSGVCHVSLTRLPYMQREVVSHFESKEDLVSALLTSCHIPLYANGSWTTTFRGATYVDGGVADFVPSPPCPTVVRVCCFPVSQVLNRIKPATDTFGLMASALQHIDISPDAYEVFNYSYRQLLTWALMPAEDDVLEMLIDKGQRDALKWAHSMGLVPTSGETSGARVTLSVSF